MAYSGVGDKRISLEDILERRHEGRGWGRKDSRNLGSFGNRPLSLNLSPDLSFSLNICSTLLSPQWDSPTYIMSFLGPQLAWFCPTPASVTLLTGVSPVQVPEGGSDWLSSLPHAGPLMGYLLSLGQVLTSGAGWWEWACLIKAGAMVGQSPVLLATISRSSGKPS